MSFTAIAGALASISAIVGGLVYVFKYSSWALTKTPAQAEQDIEKQEQENKHEAEETGRPI